MKRLYCYGVLLLGLLWSSCAKETLNYATWTVDLPTNLPLTDVHFISPDSGYASAGNLFTQGAVLETVDGGKNWAVLKQYNTGIYNLTDNNRYLIVGENGQNLYEIPLNNLFATSPNQYSIGNWWRWHDLVSLPNGDALLIGGENFGRGYIHRLKNGTLALQDTFAYELQAVALGGNGILHAVGYGTIMRSSDEGHTWTISPIQGDFFRGVAFPTDQTGYVVGEYGWVYKTTDGGLNWWQCRAGNSIFANPKTLLRDLAFIDENEGFLVGTGGIVFRTTDGGQRWKQVSNLPNAVDYTGITIAYKHAYLYTEQGTIVGIKVR